MNILPLYLLSIYIAFYGSDLLACSEGQKRMLEITLTDDPYAKLGDLCREEDIGCALLDDNQLYYDTPDPLILAMPFLSHYGKFFQYYRVTAGDSWSSIAFTYGYTVAEIQQANPHSIRPGGVLYRGERLKIPGNTHLDSYGDTRMYCTD